MTLTDHCLLITAGARTITITDHCGCPNNHDYWSLRVPEQSRSLITDYCLLISDVWSLFTDQLSLITGHWLLITDYCLLISDIWLLFTDHWLLITDYWSLITGHWLLFIDQWYLKFRAGLYVLFRKKYFTWKENITSWVSQHFC